MRRLLLLILASTLILLVLFCIRHHVGAIEADIAARSTAHLAETGPSEAAVTVDGRTVILEGTVSSEDQRVAAEEGVRRLAGVAGVDNRLRVERQEALPASPAGEAERFLELAATTRGVKLSGLVPDEATRGRWVDAATEVFGAERVTDELEVDSTLGLADSGQHAEDLLSAMASGPAGVRARLSSGSVHLLGTVSTERDRLAPEAAIRATLPTVAIQNDIEIDLRQQELQRELDRILRGTTVEFRTGSAELTDEGKRVLDRVIEQLRRAVGYRVTIEGHTDSRGSEETNLELSQARSQSVVNYLSDNGVDPAIMNARGFGETRPIATNETAEGRKRNRRIELRVAKEE